MASEVLVFWLVHLFIGLLLPFMIYMGCCGLKGNRQPQDEPTPGEQL